MSRSKGRSWDHAVRPLTEQERQAFGGLGLKCSRCTERATHMISFWSVTGGAGLEGRRQNANCATHAAAFAAKNRLDVPTN